MSHNPGMILLLALMQADKVSASHCLYHRKCVRDRSETMKRPHRQGVKVGISVLLNGLYGKAKIQTVFTENLLSCVNVTDMCSSVTYPKLATLPSSSDHRSKVVDLDMTAKPHF